MSASRCAERWCNIAEPVDMIAAWCCEPRSVPGSLRITEWQVVAALTELPPMPILQAHEGSRAHSVTVSHVDALLLCIDCASDGTGR